MGDFQRNFGYVGTWLNISELFGSTYYLIKVNSRYESDSIGGVGWGAYQIPEAG